MLAPTMALPWDSLFLRSSRFLAAVLLAGSCSAATLPFYDDFEGGLANWSPGGSWGLTSARYGSSSHAATDSPSSSYANNVDAALTLAVSLDLAGVTHPALGFQHSYAFEASYDFGSVEVSTNGGSTWIVSTLAAYTGNQGTISREQLDLSAYAGATNLRLRFRLVTDSSVVMDGWYVDDVRVADTPPAVTLQVIQTNRNSVTLGWGASTSPTFAAYRLYRSLSPGVDWHTARLIAEIGNSSLTSVTDIATSPKTRYYYRLAVVNSDGMLTLGNEVAVTTLAGMDYPFVDNGEGGGATWTADAPWALSAEDAASPARAWSESPGVSYTNGITSQSLTLAAPVFLAGQAKNPALCFNHKYDFVAGDLANVEVSTNFGTDWTMLGSYTGTATNTWQRGRLSLAAYTNSAVLLRFRITTDTAGTADGWHVDDISLAESPDVVSAPILDNVTSHSIRVSWAPNTNAHFAYYAVFRSPATGVGINSQLVATLTNQATVTWTDTGLALDTPYYYRVYAVGAYGTLSADSALESTARTLNNPTPFADGFETGLLNWNLSGGWGLTTNYSHNGAFALTESPQGNYTNSVDSYALTAVNLAGTTWAVLRFWDRYRVAEGDWGAVEVSTDGSSWQALYGVMGVRGDWEQQAIDLSPWKGQANLRLRFHFVTDGGTTEDGWYLDDLSVTDSPGVASLPLYEGFEGGVGQWLASGWDQTTNLAYAGSASARVSVGPRLAPNAQDVLELAGALDLTNAVNPQLTFWVRGQLWHYSSFRVQVSSDGGVNWTELGGANLDTGFSADWTRKQVSLQSYVGRSVRVRFAVSGDWRAPVADIAVDKVTLAEMPAGVYVNPPVPHLRSVDLSWTSSTLGAAFRRYEVYRATHATVTVADTLAGTLTNLTSTTFTDTGLSIGTKYYYKVFTVDANDMYADSNEPATTTVPLDLPVADPMESLAQWVSTGAWGLASNSVHGGGFALADSPGGDYANSVDSYALTAVNLAGTTWAVLRFWDRYRVAEGDWGAVEVSTDGSSWQALYGVMGVRGDWEQQAIDLSPWKGQANLRLRFHFVTDGGTTEDGWYLDDLSVTDSPGVASLPLYEGFEGGVGQWLASGWDQTTNLAYAGSASARVSVGPRLAPNAQDVLELAGALDLTNAVNPQLTFWVRGQLWHYSSFRVQVSSDGGVNWTELGGANLDTGFSADWTRKQVSLQSYVGRSVRVRFAVSGDWRAPVADIAVDKVSIEEPPPSVVLNPISDVSIATLRLTWVPSGLPNFKEYRLYRSETTTIDESSVLVAVLTNKTTASYTDTGLTARKTYYYRLYVYNTHDTGIGSNQASAITDGVALGWTDDFATNRAGWTYTGTWTLWPGAGREGSLALVDSPADYANSSDSSAQFGVNLAGSVWPVLRFWDRHIFADGDYGRLEISTDAGGSWTGIYGVVATRSTFAEQSVDLSPWKNYSQVWLRFRVCTDGGTTADGWIIDNLSLAENTPRPPVGYPVYEDFENGLGNWLHAGWALDTNQPFTGSLAVHDTIASRLPPDTQLALVLANELSLSNVVNPFLTFRVRGHLWHYSSFRAQVSTNGGVTWIEQSVANLDTGFDSDWTRMQISLLPYTNANLRLRFLVSGDWRAPDVDIFLDGIGIGEPAPGKPFLSAPAMLGSVNVPRPTLVVSNAFDYQSDPLTYRYEVYADAALSNLVAQVPAVAAGAGATAWPVDVDLPNNAQYWWRCQASDGTNTGPWMATASFYVNQVNHAPLPVTLAGPPSGTLVSNLDVVLFWYPTTDADAGDAVVSYHLQADENPLFASPEINMTNIVVVTAPGEEDWAIAIPLSELTATSNLVAGAVYHWRVRAADTHGAYSAWPTGDHTFQFGKAPPAPATLTGLRRGANGTMSLEWQGAAGELYVEFSLSLTTPNWQTIAGPLQGTNWIFTPVPGSPSGFYRVRSQ